jgi:hypothetical protein
MASSIALENPAPVTAPHTLMSQRMRHFIITPFCVRRTFTGKMQAELPPDAWIEHRLRLFEDYCLPSVIRQSEQNFNWFIYFDDSTPTRYLEQMRSLIAPFSHISIKMCAFWESPTLIKHVRETLSEDTRWIITSRLDNDDGVHREFVSRLHEAARERREFLNFPCGVILYAGKCYLYRHPSNAFLSLVEPVDEMRTAWSIAHESAIQVAPVRQLSDVPGFLQVVHGQNVSNKPRGHRVRARVALRGFESLPILAEVGRTETAASILLENATTVPVWRLRDVLIVLAKRLRR